MAAMGVIAAAGAVVVVVVVTGMIMGSVVMARVIVSFAALMRGMIVVLVGGSLANQRGGKSEAFDRLDDLLLPGLLLIQQQLHPLTRDRDPQFTDPGHPVDCGLDGRRTTCAIHAANFVFQLFGCRSRSCHCTDSSHV